MRIASGGRDTAMAEQQLDGAQIRPRFQQLRRKAVAVLISIVPMKGQQSPFIIVTIRFMENRAPSFAVYGATRAIK